MSGLAYMEKIETIAMEDVRQLIRRLIFAGYDCRVPKTHSDQEIHTSHEICFKGIEVASEIRKELGDGASSLRENSMAISNCFQDLRISLLPICESIDAHPVNQNRVSVVSHEETQMAVAQKGPTKVHLVRALCDLERRGRLSAADPYDLAQEAEDVLQPLDSDEEAQLHAELDALVEMQERVEAIGGNQNKYMANIFQLACLQITDIEGMYLELTSIFRCESNPENKNTIPTVNLREFSSVLDKLNLSAISQSELEEMFEEGLHYVSFVPQSPNERQYEPHYGNHTLTTQKPDNEKSNNLNENIAEKCEHPDEDARVSMASLMIASEELRLRIMSTVTDESFCYMAQASSLMHLNENQIKLLSSGGRVRKVAKGEVFLSESDVNIRSKAKFAISGAIETLQPSDPSDVDPFRYGLESPVARHSRTSGRISNTWFLVISGSFLVEDDPLGLEQRLYSELGPGCIFGGYKALSDTPIPFTVKATKGCKLLEIHRYNLLCFRSTETEEAVQLLASRMGEAPIRARLDGFEGMVHNERVDLDSRDLSQGPLSQIKLQSIKMALIRVEQVWQELCLGEKVVPYSQIAAFQQHLGEVGSELFKKLFSQKGIPDHISKAVYWEIWINFLTFETYGKIHTSHIEHEMNEEAKPAETLNIDSDVTDEHGRGILEKLHARFSRARQLSRKFFENCTVERYEPSFVAINGDLGTPLHASKISSFLEKLFPDFEYSISAYNRKEFLQVFGRDGLKTKQISFADIRKVIMERSKEAQQDGLLIQGALNSNSYFYSMWQRVISVVAGLQCIFVPVRLSMMPWKSILDSRALGLDLVLDLLTLTHVAVLANTSYRSTKGHWVTARLKLLRRTNIYCLVAAFPFDWLAFCFGASNEMCNWLRMLKLLLPFQVFIRQSGRKTAPRSTSLKLMELSIVIFSLLHFGACAWFYIGTRYKNWHPDAAVSWYEIDPSLNASSHLSYKDRYGLRNGSTVWDQYLISLYWVTATLTSYGIVGDLLPQNNVEMVYAMILMVLNIAVFGFIIGEVSSVFMIQDEEVTKARAQLDAVEGFIRGSGLEDDLREDIKLYFRATQTHPSADQATIFRKLSRILQVEVSSYTTRGYLDGLALFQGCSPQLVDAVSVLLSEVIFAPEDYLYRISEISREMFLVVDGAVDEISESEKGEKVDAVIKPGGTVGVLSFFFGMRHMTSARAGKVAGAACLRLLRDEFMDMLKLYPEDEERISQSALTQFEGTRSQFGSRQANSHAASTRTGESNALSGAVASSERHRVGPSSNSKVCSSEALTKALEGSGIRQRMAMMKRRRENKRIYGILTAAAKGDLNRLKASLQSDGDCNVSDHFHRTPLHVAAAHGQLEVTRILLAARADLEARDRFENTPLNEAVRHRHDKVALLFQERIPGLGISLSGHEIGGLMCQAAFEGDLEHICRLISNRASPSACDYDRRSALHLACCEGHVGIVRFLLEVNADTHTRDRFSGSALDDAVRHGHRQLQMILCEHGCRLTGEKYAFKMCDAAARGDLDVIRTLVENGVDAAVGDYDGRTALHLAASEGKISVLHYLLERDPPLDINGLDRVGGTPLEDAMRHCHSVAAMMIETAGGMRRHEKRLCELVGRYLAYLDPNRIDVLLRARRGGVKARLKKLRVDGVLTATENSPESKALEAIQELLLPAIQTRVGRLRELFLRLVDEIRTVCPVLLSALRMHERNAIKGSPHLLSAVLRITSTVNTIQAHQNLDLQQDKNNPIELAQALLVVLTSVNELLAAIASAREAIDAPLPSCRLVRMLSRPFRGDATELRLEIRRSADLARLLRRIFRGAQTVFRTRTFRNILRRSVSIGAISGNLSEEMQLAGITEDGSVSSKFSNMHDKSKVRSNMQATAALAKATKSTKRQSHDRAVPKIELGALSQARKERMLLTDSCARHVQSQASRSLRLSSPIEALEDTDEAVESPAPTPPSTIKGDVAAARIKLTSAEYGSLWSEHNAQALQRAEEINDSEAENRINNTELVEPESVENIKHIAEAGMAGRGLQGDRKSRGGGRTRGGLSGRRPLPAESR